MCVLPRCPPPQKSLLAPTLSLINPFSGGSGNGPQQLEEHTRFSTSQSCRRQARLLLHPRRVAPKRAAPAPRPWRAPTPGWAAAP